jgi:spermidine synthase
VFPALAILFFLSGASALIYQVLWLRLLGLVFGVTVHAASTVWAAFMAGLALGSIAAGLAGDRVRRPLLWFGAAEILTGLTAVLTPAAIAALQNVYVDVAPSLPDRGAATVAVRFAMAFGVLLVPTVLMGATMPLLVRSSAFSGSSLGTRAGALYAANTAGAIAGTLLAGLFLIPSYGIRASFAVAAGVNILVGAVACVLAVKWSAARERRAGMPAVPAATEEPIPSHGPIGLQRALVLAVFAVSGFASLALEVVWFRVITLFLRPTVYGYAFMLATLLLGIAAGSALATPLMRKTRTFDRLLALAWLEGALAVTTLLSFSALQWIPGSVRTIGPLLNRVLGDYLAYQATVSVIVILPTALLLGLAFPIGLSVWLGDSSSSAVRVARRTGTFYSLNLAGAIAGSLAAGFVLLPSLGSRGTLIALAALALLSALALLAASRAPRPMRLAGAAACTLVCAATAAAVPDPFAEYLRQRYPGERVIWRREAVQATVSVHDRQDKTLTLNVNGNHQASSSGSMPFIHRRIGNLPMALHPDPRHALVIGLGGGATAGAVSRHAGVSVDVVELSREVVTAADRFFRTINASLLQQPQVRMMVDDGRNYLLLTGTKYDVITADVILPIHAGAGNLYSAEYFTLVRRALKPGGMAVQWVAGTEAEYKLIMRTFLSVFPETTLWVDGSLMVGTLEPLRLRRKDLEWKLQIPARREMLAELDITRFEDLLALYRAGPEELRKYVGDGPVLTDDRPMVEYFLSLPRDREVDLSGVSGSVARYVEEDR